MATRIALRVPRSGQPVVRRFLLVALLIVALFAFAWHFQRQRTSQTPIFVRFGAVQQGPPGPGAAGSAPPPAAGPAAVGGVAMTQPAPPPPVLYSLELPVAPAAVRTTVPESGPGPAPAVAAESASASAPVSEPALAPALAPEPAQGPGPVASTRASEVTPPTATARPPDLAAARPPVAAMSVPVPVPTKPDAPVMTSVARVVIHHSAADSISAARAQAMVRKLQARSETTVEIRKVPYALSRDGIRVFFDADRARADAVRAAIAGPARAANGLDADVRIADYTDYRPSPRLGTIEVWLASGSAETAAASAASARSNR